MPKLPDFPPPPSGSASDSRAQSLKQGRGTAASTSLFQTYRHPTLTSLPTGFAHISCIRKERQKTRRKIWRSDSKGLVRAVLQRQGSAARLQQPPATLLPLFLKEECQDCGRDGSGKRDRGQQPTATEAKVTELQPLWDSTETFLLKILHLIQRKPYFFHKTTRIKSQFSIQKMLMENLCPAMLLNTDRRYLDFWGKEGQVIFTVWKMKLTEFIFLCEAMIDFSFCLIHTALNIYREQIYNTLDKAHKLH